MAEIGGEGETREIMEGGVTEEEMGLEGEIRGESERGVRENGFREGMKVFFLFLFFYFYFFYFMV